MNSFAEVIRLFLHSALGRRFLFALMISLTASSLIFLALFVTAYRNRLIEEHTRASSQVNELLEASLKNAMLKRDIDGLRHIVAELGRQDGIVSVMILNPRAEVRFASREGLTGANFNTSGVDILRPSSSFMTGPDGVEVLRTINPVSNEPRCNACHGSVADNPVNGILIVDYAAGQIRRDAMIGAAAMGLSGGAVLFAALAALAAVLYHAVLKPVQALSDATAAFAGGDLARRVVIDGNHELTVLGGRFNAMADRLKAMFADVKSSEAFLQTIIDAVPDGVRVIDDGYSIVKANSAYARKLGLSGDEVVGRKCHHSSHRLEIPCSPTMVICPVAALAHGDGEPLKCRQRHIRADGGEIFVEVSAARAIVDVDGVPKGFTIELIRDLAEQARVSHEQRLSEIGLLATGIAHEIHNPLSSIHLALTALRDDIAAGAPAASIDSYVETADREINRCIDVTQRLLRLSEPADDIGVLVEIAKVVADVVSLLRYQAEQAGVAIATDFHGQPRVMASESDIGILVLNLSQNAIHAMPKGGRLTITSSVKNGVVALDFVDTGVGIPAADIPKVFWPFWSKRADGTEGTGLGLAICRATVERLNGAIAVQSTIGKGTRISVALPSADAGDRS